MTYEPIIAPVQEVEPAVECRDVGVERPVPSLEQQRMADNVFSNEQSQLAAVVLGIQTGLALTHHLLLETFGSVREEEKPKRRPAPGEEVIA